jgi:hypothetical protein
LTKKGSRVRTTGTIIITQAPKYEALPYIQFLKLPSRTGVYEYTRMYSAHRCIGACTKEFETARNIQRMSFFLSPWIASVAETRLDASYADGADRHIKIEFRLRPWRGCLFSILQEPQ